MRETENFKKNLLKPLFIVSFFLLTLLASCKESPENDIITNKNEDKLEKAIKEEADAQKKSDVIQHKEDAFTAATNDLQVVVDAEVNAREGSIAIVRTIPHEITSKDLQVWVETLFDKQTAYDPAAPKSKGELEEEILFWKQQLTSKDLEEEYGGEAESVRKSYEETIANLETLYASAPDSAEERGTDYAFHPYEYYLTAEGMNSKGDSNEKDMKYMAETKYDDNGVKWEILATNRDEADYDMHAMDFYGFSEGGEIAGSQGDCSGEEALKLAEETRMKLGLDDWKVYDAQDSKEDSGCQHVFHYTRCYEQTPTLTGYDIDLKSEDLYAANLYYESLSLEVTNGKVTAVSWYSPMDIVEVENDNVKTLSFDEVYECFKSQMQSQYSKNTYLEKGWFEEGDKYFEDAEMSIRINQIEQGMFRIKIKDNSEEYRMVPAWIFKGSTFCDGEFLVEETYAVINAVDGSVINPDLGY